MLSFVWKSTQTFESGYEYLKNVRVRLHEYVTSLAASFGKSKNAYTLYINHLADPNNLIAIDKFDRLTQISYRTVYPSYLNA